MRFLLVLLLSCSSISCADPPGFPTSDNTLPPPSKFERNTKVIVSALNKQGYIHGTYVERRGTQYTGYRLARIYDVRYQNNIGNIEQISVFEDEIELDKP